MINYVGIVALLNTCLVGPHPNVESDGGDFSVIPGFSSVFLFLFWFLC